MVKKTRSKGVKALEKEKATVRTLRAKNKLLKDQISFLERQIK